MKDKISPTLFFELLANYIDQQIAASDNDEDIKIILGLEMEKKFKKLITEYESYP